MVKKFIRIIKRTDILLIILAIAISTISILSLYNISNTFFSNKKIFIVQIIASLAGLSIAISLSNINYHIISKFAKVYIPITLVLVILTFFFGFQRGSADDKAWLILPFGLSLQPSEFLKICFIISFSLHLNFTIEKIDKISNLILLLIHGFIPVILTHLQGDDGTALIFITIFTIMIFSAGISWKYISIILTLILFSSPLIWYLLNPDQKNRILITFHPENDPNGFGYQQLYGLISIGNGGLFGKGIFKDNYKFVPEIQNDFIFSFIGQAFGYIGCLIILLILAMILIRILIIGLNSEDYLGRFICIGVFSMIFTQTIFNIGMNLSILPVIGITLPLLSAGGSSLITVYIGIGLALSVFSSNNKTLFYKYN